MNEITKIHLGRQAFTISVEAHRELKIYLDAIKKQVKDKDVVDEIELRMAELLAEHGVSGDKVILPSDVEFLKKQLGNPEDFNEDETTDSAIIRPNDTKRLFRDTDDAMLAGVAAGLAQYLGVDALLIRIIFVVGIFTGGWGILLYIVLWLLVPEAKTTSDRLQMAGRPVTVDSLKEVVERADVKGAARRANNSLAGPINTFFKVALKLVGVFFIVSGLSALLGLIAAETYILLHAGSLMQDNIFPIGLKEHLLLDLGLVVAALISIFIVLFGMAMFRRKWPIRTWITGMLIGLILIGIAAGGALAVDVYPTVRDRYNANVHTTVWPVKAFSGVKFNGADGVILNYQTSEKYSVSLNYYGNPDLSLVKTNVQNGVLTVDFSRFNWRRNCQTICIPPSYNLIITVNSPNYPLNMQPDKQAIPFPEIKPIYQP